MIQVTINVRRVLIFLVVRHLIDFGMIVSISILSFFCQLRGWAKTSRWKPKTDHNEQGCPVISKSHSFCPEINLQVSDVLLALDVFFIISAPLIKYNQCGKRTFPWLAITVGLRGVRSNIWIEKTISKVLALWLGKIRMYGLFFVSGRLFNEKELYLKNTPGSQGNHRSSLEKASLQHGPRSPWVFTLVLFDLQGSFPLFLTPSRIVNRKSWVSQWRLVNTFQSRLVLIID